MDVESGMVYFSKIKNNKQITASYSNQESFMKPFNQKTGILYQQLENWVINARFGKR